MPDVSASRLATLVSHLPRTKPTYRWLADGVRSGIEAGVISPGTALPSERSLAGSMGLGRVTITHAYALLAEEGFVSARRGSGTVVTMPEVSGGPGGEALPQTAAVQEHGPIDLATALPPSHPGVAAALRHAAGEASKYLGGSGYYPGGLPEVRRALAKHYTRTGLPTRDSEILVTSGALASLQATLATLLPRGRAVVTDSPSFANALVTIRAFGGRAVGVPLRGGESDVPAMAAEFRRSRASLAYVMPDFHNPTGARMGEAGRVELAAAADAAGTRLISDDTVAYNGLTAGLEPLPHLATHAPRTIILGSTSKALWAGLRVGWLRADAATVARLGRSRISEDAGLLEQLALASLLDSGALDSPADRVRPQLREQRDLAARSLREECPEWSFDVPDGGLSLWCRLPRAASSALVEAAAREGVRLSPGRAFSPSMRGFEDHVRIPFTLPAAELEEGIRRLGRAWRSLR